MTLATLEPHIHAASDTAWMDDAQCHLWRGSSFLVI